MDIQSIFRREWHPSKFILVLQQYFQPTLAIFIYFLRITPIWRKIYMRVDWETCSKWHGSAAEKALLIEYSTRGGGGVIPLSRQTGWSKFFDAYTVLKEWENLARLSLEFSLVQLQLLIAARRDVVDVTHYQAIPAHTRIWQWSSSSWLELQLNLVVLNLVTLESF